MDLGSARRAAGSASLSAFFLPLPTVSLRDPTCLSAIKFLTLLIPASAMRQSAVPTGLSHTSGTSEQQPSNSLWATSLNVPRSSESATGT